MLGLSQIESRFRLARQVQSTWGIVQFGLAAIFIAAMVWVMPGSVAIAQDLAAGDLELNRSCVYIHVFKTGLGHEHAVLGPLKSGHLNLSTGGGGTLVFDLPRFSADSDLARKYIGLEGSTDAATRQQVNANMLGEAVLNVAQFPTATFVLKTVTPLSQKSSRGLPQLQLDGEFTLHGKVRPVRILADLESKEGWQHLRGGFSIKQTDYGMTPFSKGFGAVGVADQLEILGDFWIAAEN